MEDFQERNKNHVAKMAKNKDLQELSQKWFNECLEHEYHYHFSWLGVPIIQFPEDIVVMQELVWKVKPDFIVETGVARGGSIIFYASMLQLFGNGEVVGVDIDIRPHNRKTIEEHFLSHRIKLLEGSSISGDIIDKVSDLGKNKNRALVVLDSNHTHEHVLEELRLYSSFVKKGSYIVVFDTAIEDVPERFNENRPWNNERNPRSAVREFLKENDSFEVDQELENKLLSTVARYGFLKKIK